MYMHLSTVVEVTTTSDSFGCGDYNESEDKEAPGIYFCCQLISNEIHFTSTPSPALSDDSLS